MNENPTNEKTYEKTCCNMCASYIPVNVYGYLEEYLEIEKRWGYGSPMDNEVHHLYICQGCYEQFFSSLKIKPNTNV